MRHINIPVFIPHLGCPNHCVFCNQRSISGVKEFDPTTVKDIIEEALSTSGDDCEAEIAFFGGSFTGIDRSLMIELLEIGYSYVLKGRVKSIRCSTRPDYINEEILTILKHYGVKVIELGLQSSNDRVLEISGRGHSFEDEKKACRLIVDAGFDLIGQMMIGLPGSTPESEAETADFIIKSGAVGARIYPTVVFYDTELAALTKCGSYKPLSVDEAAERSARVLERFVCANVDVIRIGLCASENLRSEQTYFAGPNHPAIGEIVESRLFLKRITDEYKKLSEKPKSIKIIVNKGSLSKAIGQKKINKTKLKEMFGLNNIEFSQSNDLDKYEISLITEEEGKQCT